MPFGAEATLRQGRRYPVVNVFRQTTSVTVTAGANGITVVEEKVPKGHHGFLTAVGQRATNVAWNDFTWRIVVDNSAVPGFGNQVGIQWGFINNPGEVYAWIPISSVVRLVVDSAAATNELVTGTLVGYFWPQSEPSREPVR